MAPAVPGSGVRVSGRPAIRWRREAGLLAVGYAGYAVLRAVAPARHDEALTTGRALWSAERALGVDWAVALNAGLTDRPALAAVAAAYYATLHFLVTPALLACIAWRRPAVWFRARTALVLTTGLALVGYWLLPTAPPRLLGPPFGDSISSAGGAVPALVNVDAAFPSLHVAWATWSALAAGEALCPAGRALGRAWWLGYPVATTLVVLATANHYVVDAIAGGAVAGIGWAVAVRFAGWPPGNRQHDSLDNGSGHALRERRRDPPVARRAELGDRRADR